jgi:uncharacterized surface protein with fasciclin (FAS1) repeats
MRATKLTALAAATLFSISLAACGSDDDSSSSSAAAPTMTATTPSAAPSTMDSMVNFGAGCAAVPTDASNKGSFQAMAQVPVATAASGNPLLSTLVSAVDLKKVLADKKTLTSILTYHVVSGKLTPADLAGTHKTLQGGDLTVAGSGEDFKVDGTASVICGNVQTANANVYIIDSVLMPKS